MYFLGVLLVRVVGWFHCGPLPQVAVLGTAKVSATRFISFQQPESAASNASATSNTTEKLNDEGVGLEEIQLSQVPRHCSRSKKFHVRSCSENWNQMRSFYPKVHVPSGVVRIFDSEPRPWYPESPRSECRVYDPRWIRPSSPSAFRLFVPCPSW